MKLTPVKLDKWYGGISDDPRIQTGDQFAISAHFDIFSNPTKMTPYRSNISNDTISGTSSDMTAFLVQNFAVSEANGNLYGLGRLASNNVKYRILLKTDPVGNGSTWSLAASASQTTNGIPYRNTFMPYKNYLWGIKVSGAGTSNKRDVWNYGSLASGAKTLTDPVGGVGDILDDGGDTSSAQGVVGDDDCLYLPYANKLCRVQANRTIGASDQAALTLPSEYSITSLAKYQKYLAIAVKPRIFGLSSKVYLWDYVSDDISEVVDFGEGNLLVLENLDGALVGISSVTSTFNISSKTVFRQYSGGVAEVVREIPYSGLLQMKDKKSNKLYFILSDGTTLAVWVLGRKSKEYPYAITIDRLINGSTAVTTVNAFKFMGDYLFASMGTNGNIMRTNDQVTYTYTAYWKSQKFNAGSLRKDKTLSYLNLNHVPLPANASLAVSYAINSTSTFNSVFTSNSVGTDYHDAVNEESGNNRQFRSCKEFQLKIEAVGLGEPVDLTYQIDVDDTLLIEQ